MFDVDRLPIPDWGLTCPACDAPLAGLDEHRCSQCGQGFNIRRLLGAKRPVPDLDLHCEGCNYPLTGLTGTRCPECGEPFFIREMLDDSALSDEVYLAGSDDPGDHHLKRREPTFTGRERPLPDFGLDCAACGEPLTGAEADSCPSCGEAFDLEGIVPPRDWVRVMHFVPLSVRQMVKEILYDAAVPYVVDNARLTQIVSGDIPFVPTSLRIPREFFFDALHAVAVASVPDDSPDREPWICPACEEDVPRGFDLCWNCSTPAPAADDSR